MSLLRAALEYARMGWAVFPLQPRGKRPLPGTSGFKDATTNPKIIRRWWKEEPEANIGIACNSLTGPLVIDIDGAEGMRLLQRLNLPETLEATSGRKNRKHLYYSGCTERVRRTIKALPGIDILGDGGYVIAAPSIHPKTGKAYYFLNDLDPVQLDEESLHQLLSATRRKTSAPPLPEIIYEGERDNLLTSLAGSMRRRGASPQAILAALVEENERRCRPPLDQKSLERIAKSIGAKEPAKLTENLTDMGNARRFVRMFSNDVRFVKAWKNPWLIWDEQRWSYDETGEVQRFAKAVVREMYQEAVSMEDPDVGEAVAKHAHKSESSSRVNAMIDMAASEPEIASVQDVFDQDPWLLNVENGTVDLRTGKLRKPKRSDMLTKLAPVEFKSKAKAPLWKKFLRTITDHDKELMNYLQRAVGYSLTGDVREQCLFFCWGSGQNGKSTFLETIRALLGDYSQQADFSTFLQRRNEGPRNDIARMRGMRFITAVEASGSKSFDEEVLKQLTGGDRITARKLYEEAFEFQSTHKLFLAANHKPHISQQTEAMWRRIRLIPFNVYIHPSQRDDELKEKLLEELPGILNWAIEGCINWQATGLQEPESVMEATREYREEEDLIGEFLEAACDMNRKAWTNSGDLYQAFVAWWRETRGLHARPPSPQWFGRGVSERPNIKAVKRKGTRGWKGVTVIMKLRT